MIDKQRLMDETRGGLDILLDLYPQARACVEGGPNGPKMFKMRLSENTPSATIRLNKKSNLWVVHDFGGEDRDLNGIDAWMAMHNMDRSRFGAAVQLIAQEFGIVDLLDPSVNKSRFVERDAREDEKEGERYFEIGEFTDRDLKILGPGVTLEACERLHWYKLEWTGKVKDRKIREEHSTDSYPIFMRECLVSDDGARKFYKLYFPNNPNKRWRFMYFPTGAKPDNYVNGVYELEHEWPLLRDDAIAMMPKDEDGVSKEQPPKNVGEVKKDVVNGVQRYYKVVLCSGERDALCVAARGDFPIWLNSETADLQVDDYVRITKVGGTLYNIPDLDSTGMRRGGIQAMKFIDLQTVWLPLSLMKLRDNRGRSCKDFRDWCTFFPSVNDYYELMDQAAPARFWTTETTKNGYRRHRIDPRSLHNFLRLNGFCILRGDQPEGQLVRVKDGIVYAKQPRDVRDFVRKWSTNESDPDTPDSRGLRDGSRVWMEHSVMNLILTDVAFTPAYLSALPTVELDFTTSTPVSQRFFFRNGQVNVTGDGYDLHLYKEGNLDVCVWSDSVIPHDFRKMDAMFRVTERKDMPVLPDGTPRFDLEILSRPSKFMCFLINTSRLHWRKEIEEAFPGDVEAQKAYLDLHRFDIAGDHLALHEQEDQKRCLLNKIFVLGYMMHAYKDPTRPWAAYCMDYRIADGSEANGRSGKSLFLQVFERLYMKTVKLSGRNDHLLDDRFLYSDVDRYTRVIRIDDLSRRITVDSFYDALTEGVTVDVKSVSKYNLPYSKSPKFCFSTNYVPSDFDPSSSARLIYCVFGDYYHERTAENRQMYQETRGPKNDFGCALWDEYYSEDDWNADFNFLMQCEQFYLSLCRRPVKIYPPMENIMTRKLMSDMGDAFIDWATEYFAEDGVHVDCDVERTRALDDFVTATRQTKVTMHSFTKRLKAFVTWAPWIAELNPKEYLNSQGRFVKAERDNLGNVITKEYIHLRTTREKRKLDQMRVAGDIF